MPKAPDTKEPERPGPRLFVLKHNTKRVLVHRPNSYGLAIDAACKHFPRLNREWVTLQTKDLEICGGHFVELTEETWADAIQAIHSIEVVESVPDDSVAQPIAPSVPQNALDGEFTLLLVGVESPIREIYTIKVGKSATISALTRAFTINTATGWHEDSLRASCNGVKLLPTQSVGNCGIKNGDVVEFVGERLGTNPIK